ncbi:MAG: 4-(cytidine 5'-diphospho)-2-C-methyl-D-erythritol kinase [Gammaproteobacteria bacterium]
MLATPWPAPAKLNLFLHVTGKRGDGYHELQTVFQFLDWGDSVEIHPREDGRIRRLSEVPGVPADDDLVVKSARALQAATGTRFGADLRVKKRLPIGAGLGGGSSDAATTLVALNQLWGLGLPTERLIELGVQLGADIPIFIHGQAAWAEGVGEKLTTLSLDEPWFLIIQPPCMVSTEAVFADRELTRDSTAITIADFFNSGGRNDCEPVVRARYPEVAKALDWLNQWGDARLTGTGACVFAHFSAEAQARDVIRALPHDWQGFVARGLNRSPLLDRLAREHARGSHRVAAIGV